MRRIIVKVGSSTITKAFNIQDEVIVEIARFVQKLQKFSDVIIVSSGAVSAGETVIRLDRDVLENRQALASIGQPKLLACYQTMFEIFDITVSQVLLTELGLNDALQLKAAQNTIDVLLRHRIVPVINENDVVYTKELIEGDNDRLSALAALAFGADTLVMITDNTARLSQSKKDLLPMLKDSGIDVLITDLSKLGEVVENVKHGAIAQ